MARIVGNLRPEDDFTHPLGPEANFNESMYFNFFDARRELGGFVRLGNRANERCAEMTLCLFLPDGRVLFDFRRPPIADNDAFDAGGMRFDVLEPSQHLRTRYAGSAVALREPREMADPRRAFRENPTLRVELDLAHEAVGPMYGHTRDDHERDEPAERQFARAHYEQHMRVRGTLEIERERHQIDGFGLRDHSWGPRFWQAIHRYAWLTMNFGPDLGAVISVVERDAAGRKARRGGVLVRGQELELLTGAEVDVDYEANGLYHTAVRARATTRSGEKLEIHGRVRAFIPLRNRRSGQRTLIGEGMTEWQFGERVGHGLSELLRQI